MDWVRKNFVLDSHPGFAFDEQSAATCAGFTTTTC